jgi:hypothetical protein
MPAPPRQRVVPPGKHLLHPLHDPGQRKPVLGPDIKANPAGLNTEAPDLEGETEHGFPEDLVKKGGGFWPAEEGFPVVDIGARFIPDVPGKFTCLSHTLLWERNPVLLY